jgi:hypothetical protein
MKRNIVVSAMLIQPHEISFFIIILKGFKKKTAHPVFNKETENNVEVTLTVSKGVL